MVARRTQKVEQQLAEFIMILRDFPLLLFWLFARRYYHTQSRLKQIFKLTFILLIVFVFSPILIENENLLSFKLATCA